MLGSMLIRHPWRGMIDPLAAYDAWPVGAGDKKRNRDESVAVAWCCRNDFATTLPPGRKDALITNRVGQAVRCGTIEVRQRECCAPIATEVCPKQREQGSVLGNGQDLPIRRNAIGDRPGGEHDLTDETVSAISSRSQACQVAETRIGSWRTNGALRSNRSRWTG